MIAKNLVHEALQFLAPENQSNVTRRAVVFYLDKGRGFLSKHF